MGKSKRIKVGLVAVAVVLVTVATAFAFTFPGFGKYETVKAERGVVAIPVSKVSDGKAHFFQYVDGGKEINFFVVKGTDGIFHTAFDACDVCFREKKGYVQQGDSMVCKNCNRKFPVNRIGAGSESGCNPSQLTAKINGTRLLFTVSDLRFGKRLF